VNGVGFARMLEIGASLDEPERDVVEVLSRLRLMSHGQLAALLDDGRGRSTATKARAARRTLRRLTELRVLARLQRRIGGLRAGSAGFVYYLGPVGQRLISYWQGQGLVRGRFRPEPGSRYVRHRLAVSELYVQALLAARAGELDLLAFEAEPDCWRTFTGGLVADVTLKPDAYLRLGLGAYEESAFVEVDLATESRSVLAAKTRAYVDYFNASLEQAQRGVFPRVLLLTTTEARKAVLVEICTRLDADYWPLFTVTTLDRGLQTLRHGAADDANVGEATV
jgi:hypothetical protein